MLSARQGTNKNHFLTYFGVTRTLDPPVSGQALYQLNHGGCLIIKEGKSKVKLFMKRLINYIHDMIHYIIIYKYKLISLSTQLSKLTRINTLTKTIPLEALPTIYNWLCHCFWVVRIKIANRLWNLTWFDKTEFFLTCASGQSPRQRAFWTHLF